MFRGAVVIFDEAAQSLLCNLDLVGNFLPVTDRLSVPMMFLHHAELLLHYLIKIVVVPVEVIPEKRYPGSDVKNVVIDAYGVEDVMVAPPEANAVGDVLSDLFFDLIVFRIDIDIAYALHIHGFAEVIEWYH